MRKTPLYSILLLFMVGLCLPFSLAAQTALQNKMKEIATSNRNWELSVSVYLFPMWDSTALPYWLLKDMAHRMPQIPGIAKNCPNGSIPT